MQNEGLRDLGSTAVNHPAPLGVGKWARGLKTSLTEPDLRYRDSLLMVAVSVYMHSLQISCVPRAFISVSERESWVAS